MQQDMQYKQKHVKNVWLGNSNEIMSKWNFEIVHNYAAVLTESKILYVAHVFTKFKLLVLFASSVTV